MHMLCLITYKVRSENGYGFLRPGLKTRVGNGIFWSEIGSGFGDKGGTTPPNIPRSTSLTGCYTYQIFSLRIRKTTASKYDPTNTQKSTRTRCSVKTIGFFKTVGKRTSGEDIAIGSGPFTFLSFLPAGILSSDLKLFLFFRVRLDRSCSVFFDKRSGCLFFRVTVTTTKAVYLFVR